MTLLARAAAALVATLSATLVLLTAPTFAQDLDTARFDALIALAEAKMAEYRIPGVAVGIIDNGVLRTRGLQSYQGATFSKNQAIAHRGLVETLPNAEPLATQPNPAPYVGRYLRPINAVVVRADGGRLFVQERPNTGDPRPEMPIAFFGPDRAFVTDGADRGQTIEFIRAADASVNWIRVVGRVAVRTKE